MKDVVKGYNVASVERRVVLDVMVREVLQEVTFKL